MNLWDPHRLSEKVNGAESATGEAGEEEEWRYGPVRSAAAACGRCRFCLFTQALADLSLLRKQRWRRGEREAEACLRRKTFLLMCLLI